MKPDSLKNKQIKNKYKIMEKNWDKRFILEKIPKYDAYKDLNYLSLGLIKTKIRHEEKEKQKKSQEKQKKLRTNSSRHTLNTKPKKAMYSPLLTLLKENEKTDLFTLKLTKRPLTIKRKKMNKTIEFNNIKLKDKNDEKEKRNEKEYYTKTYENKNPYKNKQTNNKVNESIDSDRENIVIDEFLSGELNEIKELWNNLGVTPEYQIFFGEMLDRLKTREIVVKYLTYEKRQLKEFKSDLERLMNDIYKRENDLNNLKKMEEIYAKNEQLNQYNFLKNKKRLKKIKNLKSKNNKSNDHKENDNSLYNNNRNEYDEDNIEKSKEYDEELAKYKENKEKIENDIGNFLKLLRLHTINAVSQFTKFRINYNFYFTSGKNDVNQMKNGYEFDYNYLLKIKKDCEFFKNSSIKNIYNFAKNSENDPFFLNLLNTNVKNNKKFKYLTATEDTLNQIKECMFILDQEEIYFKISQNINNNNSKTGGENDNNNDNNASINEHENSDSKLKSNKSPKDKNPIGTNFQGNLENVISKLRTQNEYQNLFFNSGETKDQLFKDIDLNEKMKNKYENVPKKIPETSSKQLIQNFQYYDKIRNDIYDTEEINNIKNNMYKNSNKIVIQSKNINDNKENILPKGGLNLNFNSTLKKIKNENDNNSLKISINSIKSINKNNKNEKNNSNINQNDKIEIQAEKNKENKVNNNDNIEKNNPNDGSECDNKNIENENTNNLINNEKGNEENQEKIINYQNISILSLVSKEELVAAESSSFKIGKYLFKNMNSLNLNILINSLKINQKYSITNSKNSIILSSPEEIQNILNYITKNNNIPNYNSLQKNIDEEYLYISEDIFQSMQYAFTSSALKFNFSQIISYSIVYNEIVYNGIKINSSSNIIQIEEDIELYTIPTNDENILIYICPYNEKIQEIIKKYDKYNNIFNGFSTFVNLINLYFDDNIQENNGEERKIWVPCFEIDTQLICDKIPGYQKIIIKKNDDNKELSLFEYDEIIRISIKPKINDNAKEEANEENDDINMDDNDIVIENDFLFGIYHKEMKNKYSVPFVSLAYVGKDNFLMEGKES